MTGKRIFAAAAALGFIAGVVASVKAEHTEFEFTRMVAHWDSYGDPAYLDFIEEAKPEVAQVGFYGAHFYSLIHTPEFGGYPAHFPVRGQQEGAAWFRGLNAELHRRGVKVVGHFNVEFLVGDPTGPEGPRGFFRWYREEWDEALFGPKPVDDPMDLLEKQADGSPIVNRSYAIGGMSEYWACLRNPAWRQVLKAWVARGIDLGVDGYVINYFYRHDCLCEHCQRAFRGYLKERFSTNELRELFGIEDLTTHRFSEIVSWHDPKDSTPFRREMLRFSQVSNKEAFDEVFVRHGRSLKPDLILAQWNHLGDFSAINGDERCMLPDEIWGRDETYLWYSTGGAANFTDLRKGNLGEATLQARYLRGAFRDKPFTLGKYEATRIRTAIAELAANGGAPMGFYTRFTDLDARREIVRYYGFLRRYEDLYQSNRLHTEAVLLFPRKAVQQGNLEPLKQFREAGRTLLDDHVLFEVLPDDAPDRAPPGVPQIRAGLEAGPPPKRSRFMAPSSVRVSASRPAQSDHEIDLHFVNYNREEPPRTSDGAPSPGSGITDEKPVSVEPFEADVLLPEDASVKLVQFLAPERPEPQILDWTAEAGSLRFQVPEFLVYGVVRVLLE